MRTTDAAANESDRRHPCNPCIELAGRLSAINDRTAGNFKAVWDKYAFTPDRHQDETIESLRQEVE
jgi:hypothetical protein